MQDQNKPIQKNQQNSQKKSSSKEQRAKNLLRALNEGVEKNRKTV